MNVLEDTTMLEKNNVKNAPFNAKLVSVEQTTVSNVD